MQKIIQEITLLKVITYGLQGFNQLNWKIPCLQVAYKFNMGRELW
jgi:hypothetical protein